MNENFLHFGLKQLGIQNLESGAEAVFALKNGGLCIYESSQYEKCIEKVKRKKCNKSQEQTCMLMQKRQSQFAAQSTR